MNLNNILIYETENHINFYPFNIMHPVWELRCGAFRLFEKIRHSFPKVNINFYGRELHTRSFLKRFDFSNSSPKDKTLILNAQVIPNKAFFNKIENIDADTKIIYKDEVVAYYINNAEIYATESAIDFKKLESENLNSIELDNIDYLGWIYEALDHNGKEIENDIELINSELTNPKASECDGAYLINPENIHVGKNVKIAPGAVIDASEGKIYLGNNVKIMPQATLIGPVAVGANSTIKIGAKIYEDTSFGEWCKVGGEVENTIIQSYSNKQHEGFLGHAFLSEWVNLGADTNNSDLKNTYGNIKIRMEDRIIDTGRMFMGLLCGDHTKSSINAMFTTGTVAGICGIVVREWFMPNFIKSFTWGGKNDSPVYHLNKAIDTAKIVMARRNKTLTEEEAELMKLEYEKSK